MKIRLAVTCLWLLALSLPGLAQDVSVGGRVIMRLDTKEAADAVTARIEKLLSQGADPEQIKARKDGEVFSVFWGEERIVTATAALASANKSSSQSLAIRWAEQLYDTVGPGLLRVKPTSAVLPVGGTLELEVGGLAEGPISAEGGNGVVAVDIDDTGMVILRGLAVGRTKVVLKRGQGRVGVPVHVKDWAGYPPDRVTLKVTGNPAPGQMVAEAGLQALWAQTRVNPGCRVRFDGGLPDIPSVPSGQNMKFSLAIKISGGDDYYPVVRRVPIEVQSLQLEPVEPNLLLVSNRPERVDKDGVLLEYTFSKQEPCRLMYSHLNETRGRRNLWVNLQNPTAGPVEVLIGWTYAGPNRNEVHTGHSAAVRFLDQLGKGAGYVITLAPRETYELAYHDMGTQDLVSGFVNLRILEGEKLRAEVISALAPSRNDSRNMERLGGPFNPFKIHPHGVFAQPWFEEWVDFKPGDEPVSVPYGKSPWLIDFETGLPNTGNFGVIYRYNFVVTNPTRQSRQFRLIFNPVSGPGAGTFLVDDQVVEADFRRKGVPATIYQFTVGPGQERTVKLVTVPEASSNYPAQVEITDQ